MVAVDNGTCTSARAQKCILTIVVIIERKMTEGSWNFLVVDLELGLLYN
jgi:hypothetical protein